MPPFGRIAANHDVIYPRYDPALFVGRRWLVDQITAACERTGARHVVLVGEPGAGKSAFLAYLAEAWNCPRHFIRSDNLSGIAGLDPRAFLLSIATQLFHKYGASIFAGSQRDTTTVYVGLAKDKAEIVGRLIEELHAPLPFLPPRAVKVHVGAALGQARVIGERVQKLVNTAWDLPESTLLHIAVLQPLQQLHLEHPDETVTILVDALDEAVQNRGVNILDVLPRPADPGLPPNLRLVVTTRPSDRVLTRLTGADFIRLDDEARGFSEHNRADAREYTQRRLKEAPLGPALTTMPREQVHRLIEALDGETNFLYLFHYLNTLHAAAAVNALDLAALPVPRDLDDIYRFFAVERVLRQVPGRVRFTIQGPDPERLLAPLGEVPGVQQAQLHERDAMVVTTKPDAAIEQSFALAFGLGLRLSDLRTEAGEQLQTLVEKYMPVLGMLATVREAVTATQLADWAGVERAYVVGVLNQLDEFLDDIRDGSETRYRLYHRSFAEYLTDAARNRDFPLDAVQYHARIAAHYRRHALTWSDVDWTPFTDDPYPFRHLPAHLVEAREADGLIALLTGSRRWMDVQFQMTRGDAAYRESLALAIDSLTDPLEPADVVAAVGLYTARQIVAERASIYGDTALQILTCLGRTEEAVASARLRPSARERLTGLSLLYQTSRARSQTTPDLVDDLLRVVHGDSLAAERVGFAIEVAGLVAGAADRRADEVIAVAVESCRSLKDPDAAEDKLGQLAIALAHAARADQTIAIASLMPTEHRRSFILLRSVEILGEMGQLDAGERVLASIEDAFDQDQARHKLACSAVHCGDLERARALVAAITAEGWAGEWSSEVLGQIALAHARSDEGRDRAAASLDEAWRQANTVENPYRRADTLALLGGVLGQVDDPRARAAFESAVAFVTTQQDKTYIIRTIGCVARAGCFAWAYELVLTLPSQSSERKDAQAEIAVALAERGRYAEAMQAIAVVRHQRGGHFHGNEYFSRLAHHLAAAGEVALCLQIVRMIDRMAPRYGPCVALATWLVDHDEASQAADVATFIRQDWDTQCEATRSFNRITMEMPMHGASADAMQSPHGHDDRRRQDTPLTDLAEALATAAGRPDHWAFELALSVARGIQETWEQAEALRQLALCLARWQAPGVAALFDEAQAADSRWVSFYERKTVRLQQLVRRLAEAGDFSGAETLLPAVPAGRDREFAQRYVAAALAQAGKGERGVRLAAAIEQPGYRHEALRDVALGAVATGSSEASVLLRDVLRTLPSPQASDWHPPHEAIVNDLARIGRYELAAAVARAGLSDPAGIDDDRRVREALAGLVTGPLPSPQEGGEPPPAVVDLLGELHMCTDVLFPVCLESGWFSPALDVVRGKSPVDRQRLATRLVSALIRAERYADAAQAASLVEGTYLLRRAVLEAVVDRAVRRGFSHQGINVDIDGLDLVKPLVDEVWKHRQDLDFPGMGVNDIDWDALDAWQALIYLLPGLLPRSLFVEDPDVMSARDYDKRHDVYQLGIALLGKALLDERRYDHVIAMVASTSAVLHRDSVLGDLAEGLAAAGQFDHARVLIAEIGYPQRRRDAVQSLAESLARAGRFAEALRTRESSTLDEEIHLFHRWIPFMEKRQPGLALRCVAEAARVAGWTRQDWAEIGHLLADASTDASQ